MTVLRLRDPGDVEFDLVSLGEVMLRLDPGERRIREARTFQAWAGGGEFNVAHGIASCYGFRSAVVTALAANDIGELLVSLVRSGGVDTRLIRFVEDGGTGPSGRNGLNFTERGFGLRGAMGVSDRANSAASMMEPDDVDWDDLFGRRGVRWLHTGGVFTALSVSTARTAVAAAQSARRHGTVVSYDVNFRESLWRAMRNPDDHRGPIRDLLDNVDVLFSNENEYRLSVGDMPVADEAPAADKFERMVGLVHERFPHISIAATTLREVHSASDNGWGSIGWSAEGGFVRSVYRDHVGVLDRVGAGDSFAAGVAYGLLTGASLKWALELGTAHGALAMTTPGDTSAVGSDEVEALASGGSATTRR